MVNHQSVNHQSVNHRTVSHQTVSHQTVKHQWWKESIVYQIWPASYKDSNGDGVGDIRGIVDTLDYLKELGIDVIWISPMYDSPQDDMGYDISDYEKIYEKYGTLNDMEDLINESHKRGLKIILDLVINHTSNQHEWFKESRSSKTNPKRDWYIWKPPRYDENGNRQPPNNWGSYFSGSAWTYDQLTDEYYLHLFAESQPDLNWENKLAREAIYKSAILFWLQKGIDGFRIDTAGMYSKVQSFKDVPIIFPDKDFQPCKLYHQHGPRIHEFHKEIYERFIEPFNAITVGEVGHSTREESLKYVSEEAKEMNMMFLFDVVEVGVDSRDRFRYKGYDLIDFKRAFHTQSSFSEGTDAWSTIFIENHDQPRSISRFGNDSPEFRVQSGKALATLQVALTGTEFIYQGQEIGMINLPRSWDIKEYQDINTVNYFRENGSKTGDNEKLMDVINLMARDNARSPIQWNSSSQGGFTSGTPWTRVHDNYEQINVESQLHDPTSMLSFWKQAIRLRKQYKELFVYGRLEILDWENENIFTFLKIDERGNKAYVVINFTAKSVNFVNLLPDKTLTLILSNQSKELSETQLMPYESRIYLVQ
ncbi:glycoside hydrolase superfamily [Scheffersomyces amazonensis]|uniref:glycoside hydrolase superfamily n=1 Tax=Scheffersomyces amazonensis TaxID=1078765 RepID=UPI00315CFDF1